MQEISFVVNPDAALRLYSDSESSFSSGHPGVDAHAQNSRSKSSDFRLVGNTDSHLSGMIDFYDCTCVVIWRGLNVHVCIISYRILSCRVALYSIAWKSAAQ